MNSVLQETRIRTNKEERNSCSFFMPIERNRAAKT